MLSQFAIFDLGTPELLLILAIILVLFGGKKLPELSRSLGSSIKEFKSAVGSTEELKKEIKEQVAETKEQIKERA